MDTTLILGIGAVAGAVALLASCLRSRPSAAAANLFAGLAVASPEARRSSDSVLQRAGSLVRRVAPGSLVTSLETKLAQAGHPLGLDLGKLLGIKLVVAVGTLVYIAGLIGASEMSVFQAAQRAGNLPWALEEMAESGLRRFAYRFRATVDVLLPLGLLAFGGLVLFIGLGLLLPLFSLINFLT